MRTTVFDFRPLPWKARFWLVLALTGLGLALPAWGLIMVGKGNAPVRDPGWRPGALAVANLKTRLGWTEGPPFGGGQWTFYYRGSTEQLQDAVDAFANITADKLEVLLHDGQGASRILDKPEYDWSFEIWVQGNWDHLFNNADNFFDAGHPNFGKAFPAPRLDVWLHAEGPDWAKIKVPAKLTVQDTRATGNGFPPGSGSVIRLKVTDYADQPLPKAVLQLAATGGGEAKVLKEFAADGQGAILATGIVAGTYRLAATAPGFAPRLVEHGSYGTNDYRMFSSRLAPAVTLIGKVVDEEGNPLAKVNVHPLGLKGPDGKGYQLPDSATTLSDDTGHFQLTGIPAGKLQLQAWLTGYHYVWDPKEVMEARDNTKTGSESCVLKMVPTGIVHVQLVDTQSKPVKPARAGEMHVNIQDADREGIGSWGGGSQVDTNGMCEFTSVPPGRYRLSTKPFIQQGQPPDVNEIIVTVKPRGIAEVNLVK